MTTKASLRRVAGVASSSITLPQPGVHPLIRKIIFTPKHLTTHALWWVLIRPMSRWMPVQTRFFATPPVASPAERWLGRAVTVQSPTEHLLLAARSIWNILQFELTPRSKGLYALTDQWRRVMSPQWRPARMGVLALVGEHEARVCARLSREEKDTLLELLSRVG